MREMTLKEAIASVGPGWEPLIRRCWEAMESVGGSADQVKEKFGGLRFYWSGSAEASEEAYLAAEGVIERAEEESFKICERCGAPGEVVNTRGWWRTLCKSCAILRMTTP